VVLIGQKLPQQLLEALSIKPFVVIPPERANAWQLARSFLHILHVSSNGMFLF